jgi:hypothetical protein
VLSAARQIWSEIRKRSMACVFKDVPQQIGFGENSISFNSLAGLGELSRPNRGTDGQHTNLVKAMEIALPNRN